MKRSIKFNEIIECSSQQSIVSGQAGFGIRTFTEGFDAELARSISEQVSSAYEVGIADQVTSDQIANDPKVVTQFPRTLKYCTAKDSDGKEKYIIVCSTYVGIDYGYFCNIDTAQRAGSNYVADILVFDEKPTAALFHALLEQKIFKPIDNTCDPNNPELQELLTGEPSYLPARIVEVDDEAVEIDEQTALVAMALLQTKINKNLGKDSALQNIVIQAQEAKVPAIMKHFAAMPDALVDDKYFHTNYLQGYGMPNGFRIMFLNETNKEEVYTDNYVYLNLDEQEFLNVDTGNFYFGKIKEAAAANNYPLFHALVNNLFQLSVQSNTDYRFLYNLFIATETDKKLSVGELTEDFFTKAKNANMPKDKLQKFVGSVQQALDETIQKKTDQDCKTAMKVVAYLYNNWKEILVLNETSKTDLTNLWFTEPTRKLAEYSQMYGIDVVQYLNTKDIDPNDFYASMRMVSNPDYWVRFLSDQFGEKAVEQDAVTVIDNILASQVQDKSQLVTRIYPLNKYQNVLASYIIEHPGSMTSLALVVSEICKQGKIPAMLRFLEAGGYSAATLSVMQPIVKTYFDAKLKAEIEKQMEEEKGDKYVISEGIKELAGFINRIPEDNVSALGIPQYVVMCIKYYHRYPKAAQTACVETFLKLKDNKEVSEGLYIRFLEYIYRLSKDDTDYTGSYHELLIARRLGKSLEVRRDIMHKLLKDRAADHNKLDTARIRNYFTDKYSEIPDEKNKEEARQTLDTLWKLFENATTVCEECTPVIIDSSKWSSDDRKKYLQECKNDKEKAFFKKYYGLVNSIIHKLFKK